MHVSTAEPSERPSHHAGRAPALALALLLGASTSALVAGCGGGESAEAQRSADALMHVRSAFSLVTDALHKEGAQHRSVREVLDAAVAESGADAFVSPVDGSPYRFNPALTDWQPQRGTRPDAVLIVGPPPDYLAKDGVIMIGVRGGNLPTQIREGQEPAWLASAVTATGS